MDGTAGRTRAAMSTRDIVASIGNARGECLRAYSVRAADLPWPLRARPPGPALPLAATTGILPAAPA